MPEGSSSDAPVIRPGPNVRKKCWIRARMIGAPVCFSPNVIDPVTFALDQLVSTRCGHNAVVHARLQLRRTWIGGLAHDWVGRSDVAFRSHPSGGAISRAIR